MLLETGNDTETRETFMSGLESDLRAVDSRNTSRTILASGDVDKDSFLRQFSTVNRRVVIGSEFVRDNIAVLDGVVHPDKGRLIEQLLCAYADHLVTPDVTTTTMTTSNLTTRKLTATVTSNTHFVRHLRISELFTSEGIAIENINVRWAKHTTKTNSARFQKQREDKARELRGILQNSGGGAGGGGDIGGSKNATINTVSRGNFTGSIRNKLKQSSPHLIRDKSDSNNSVKQLLRDKAPSGVNNLDGDVGHGGGGASGGEGGKKGGKDQLTHMVCLFCNYIRHITGHHGCPTMKHLC